VPKAKGFPGLGLSKELTDAVADMGFVDPTPIQLQAIPEALKGRDLIGQARTGTGKTAAYVLPSVDRIRRAHPRGGVVRLLVLCPTRELALQVTGEVEKMTATTDFRVLSVYGGASIEKQVRALRQGVDAVVGTPGRVIDLTNRRELKLDAVDVLVLDEADRMLDMGFIDDIRYILSKLPATRQTLLFSATMPPEIMALADDHMRNPLTVQVSADVLTVPTTEQVFYRVGRRNKMWALTRILEAEKVNRALVFCNTKRGVDLVTRRLKEANMHADALHGDFSQARREAVLRKFREGKVRLLVASDVAARGLDIEETSHVINYDTPDSPESYVHRVGRTSRAGREGKAITFVTKEDEGAVHEIQVFAGTRIREEELPEPSREDRIRMVVDFDHLANAFGMVPLEVNIGTKDGLRTYDLVRFLGKIARVEESMIGHIEIGDASTRFDVHKQRVERVLQSLRKTKWRGRAIRVDLRAS
jgi:ATP-dependent RNA helicase DeaD